MCEEKLEDVEAEELRGVSPARRRHRTGASTTNRRGRNRTTADEVQRHQEQQGTKKRDKGQGTLAQPHPPPPRPEPWRPDGGRQSPHKVLGVEEVLNTAEELEIPSDG